VPSETRPDRILQRLSGGLATCIVILVVLGCLGSHGTQQKKMAMLAHVLANPRLRVAGWAVCERAACSGIPTAQLFSDWIKNALENVMPEGLVEVKVANEEDRKGSTRAGRLCTTSRCFLTSDDGILLPGMECTRTALCHGVSDKAQDREVGSVQYECLKCSRTRHKQAQRIRICLRVASVGNNTP